MMRRRRGPGLVGTVARTAVIAGTATAVSGSVAQKQAAGAQQKQQAAAQQAAAAQAAAAPPPAATPDYMEELKKLAELKNAGILTEEEFEAKKKQILGL